VLTKNIIVLIKVAKLQIFNYIYHRIKFYGTLRCVEW